MNPWSKFNTSTLHPAPLPASGVDLHSNGVVVATIRFADTLLAQITGAGCNGTGIYIYAELCQPHLPRCFPIAI